MEEDPARLLEPVQQLLARLIATSPAGEGLCLVGGLRYRLLDGSCRASVDIDYHWEGDLDLKREEILRVLRRKLLPEVSRRFRYDGRAEPLTGPDDESASVKTIALALFRANVPGSRTELPVDVTRIACLDPPVVRTVGGTVYLTASDADMVESKVIALLQRAFVQARDLLDLFLFQDAIPPDADVRMNEKLASLSVGRGAVEERLAALRRNVDLHIRGVDRTIHEQVDGPAAENLRRAGGGRLVCEAVLRLVADLVGSGPREKGPTVGP